MKTIFKGICTTLLLAFSFGHANAQLINFNLSGTVNSTSGSNPFGLRIGDSITASASFDDSLLGNFTIDFDAPDIAMTITVGNTVFIDADDFSDGAWLHFDDDDIFDGINFNYDSQMFRFSGLNFSSDDWDKDFDSSNYCCDFNGDNFAGQWTSASVSAVPVPAAVWLFGSGLLGLTGMARRKTS